MFYNFSLPWDLPPPTTLALTCSCVGPSSSLQGADSRDLQMNQALRLLENEHLELQAKIECLQGDRDLCSSDSQLLQGTLLLGDLWPSEPTEGNQMERKASFSLSFVWLALRFHFTLRERQGYFNHPRLKFNFAALENLVVSALFSSPSLQATSQLLPHQSRVSSTFLI